MIEVKFTPEEMARLRQTDFMKLPGYIDAEDILTREHGAIGTPERAAYDAESLAWYKREYLDDKPERPAHRPARRSLKNKLQAQ